MISWVCHQSMRNIWWKSCSITLERRLPREPAASGLRFCSQLALKSRPYFHSGFLVDRVVATAVPRIHPSNLFDSSPIRHRQTITRSYFYLPVSWSEFKERLQRWMERTEQRIIKVRLLNRQHETIEYTLPSESAATVPSKPPVIIAQRKNPWKRRKNVLQVPRARKQVLRRMPAISKTQHGGVGTIHATTIGIETPLTISTMPLPSQLTSTTAASITSTGITESPSKVTDLRNRYQGWKLRRKEQYQGWKLRRKEQYQRWKHRRKEQYEGWKLRRQEQYQSWKLRRQAQYQHWRDRRSQAWTRTRQILLQEYSKPEWFDSLGRPLTSRDSTSRFVNPWQSQSTNGIHSLGTILRWRWQRLERELRQLGLAGKILHIFPWNPIPMSKSPLLGQSVPPLPDPDPSTLQFTWIGHSTSLFHVRKDFTILTDPIMSVRASPYQHLPVGVARDLPAAYTIPELVEHQKKNQRISENGANGNYGMLDICCITHDHYDHMDKDTTKDLKDHVQLWVVPLGIADWLENRCGIDRNRIVELEWWQQLRVGKLNGTVVVLDEESDNDDRLHTGETMTITCCPASHWASRTLWDRNFRLWCSFAFATPSFNFFFCGDTGYPEAFPLFHQIGDALGPFDFCAIPIAAYEPEEMMKDAHVNPREAVKIHKDLRSRHSVGIHWGSFQLSEEAMDAPPRDLLHAIREEEESGGEPVKFSVLGHGQTFVVSAAESVERRGKN